MVDFPPTRSRSRTWARPAGALLLLTAALLGSALAVPAWFMDTDTGSDVASVLANAARPLGDVGVLAVVSLIAITVAHYVAAAVSAWAAAGISFPRGELVAAQLAAAAANRLTPAGLGGATVLSRYFVRRGKLPAGGAAAAMSSLALLGAIADVITFAVVLGVGVLLGAPGARAEVPKLGDRLLTLVPIPGVAWLWAAAAIAVAAGVAALVMRRRLLTLVSRTARDAATTVGALARHPVRLLSLMTASAMTTALLALGFATAAVVGRGGLPAGQMLALMLGFMVASAAGNALPTPGGIGTTDAALAGVLLTAGMPAANAIVTVLVFRVITFWAPAALGLPALHQLGRRGAL